MFLTCFSTDNFKILFFRQASWRHGAVLWMSTQEPRLPLWGWNRGVCQGWHPHPPPPSLLQGWTRKVVCATYPQAEYGGDMENVRTGWSYIRVWVRITQYVCMDCYSCFITGNKLYFILKQLHFCLYANFGVFSFQYTMYMYGIFTLIAVANKMWHIPWVRFVGLIFFFFFY